MGEGIVPFGHKGFNERVNKFNFSCSKACENVYMCQGYSQYDIAENAVKSHENPHHGPWHEKPENDTEEDRYYYPGQKPYLDISFHGNMFIIMWLSYLLNIFSGTSGGLTGRLCRRG